MSNDLSTPAGHHSSGSFAHCQGLLSSPLHWCDFLLMLLGCFFLFGNDGRAGEVYELPAHLRTDRLLNDGWRFIREDVTNATSIAFNDSAWTTLDLPHTWNNLDGQGTTKDYYRGVGWYRKVFRIDKMEAGRQFFVKFDGAFSVADVYLNGQLLGRHAGGFAAFVFDITAYLIPGGDNVMAVRVNNALDAEMPPLSADFTFFGGLYRDVHLLATAPIQISPLDYGSPGVYLKTTQVSSNSARLEVATVVSNATCFPRRVMVRCVIADQATNIVSVLTNEVLLPPATRSNATSSVVILKPHLWDGLADPYLYQAHVEVWWEGKVVDVVTQPLGFRYFKVDADRGFFLNGRPYDLHGVCMHQDWLNQGWALRAGQLETNFMLIKEIGATAVRLSHYQHHDYTYRLADQSGVVLWTEIPLVNRITESPSFYASARQQLTELIRQQFNHPAVMFWGIFNEITMKPGPSPVKLARELAALAAMEDPTRPSVSAANSSDEEPSSWCTELNAFNKYFGWYDGRLGGFGPWADRIHAKFPQRCIGITEYGAGASMNQHSEEPVRMPPHAGPYHPQEYQNLYHEVHWQEMQARPFLWCKFVWNLFDFAVSGRNEGDTPGRNDKGLITYDRQLRKDAFFFYKANWAREPMLYITGRTFANRQTNNITAKVYANCDTVELFLNDVSQGALTSTNRIFWWPLALASGTNTVAAVGKKSGVTIMDSVVWNYPAVQATTEAARPDSKSGKL